MTENNFLLHNTQPAALSEPGRTGYFTWLLYDTTTIIIPTMITEAPLLLIGRDAARDLGMARGNAGTVVDVAGGPLSLTQDAVSQRLAALELEERQTMSDTVTGPAALLST